MTIWPYVTIGGLVLTLVLSLSAMSSRIDAEVARVEQAQQALANTQTEVARLEASNALLLEERDKAKQLADERAKALAAIKPEVITRIKVVHEAADSTNCFDAQLPADVLQLYTPDRVPTRSGSRASTGELGTAD